MVRKSKKWEKPLEAFTPQELISELELLESVQSSRKRQRGIDYYVPNSVQYKVHSSKADFVLFSAGNRSGKSTAGAVEIVLHCTRKYPDWFPMERRFFGPVKCVIVATENAIIEKVIEPKLKQFMPADYVAEWKHSVGRYLSRVVCSDGSTIDLLSNEQDDLAFESQDWDFYWGDEPQKERKFQAIMRGLVDRMGHGIITFTPLVEPWMKEKLVDRADGKHIDVVQATTYDNMFDINGEPILSLESIKRFEEQLPDDVKETRIHGKFFHLRGIVYQEFSDIHQIEFDYKYPDPVICTLDPHDRQPHHVTWTIVDRTNDLYVHSELIVRCTVEELAKRIKVIESLNGYKMKMRLIDPNFGRKPLITTGRNMIEELHRAGCGGWIEADDAKDEGRLRVKSYLHYDYKKPISHTNKPKLFFHKLRVPATIRSMRNYQYEEWEGKIAGERDPKERVKDKDDHGADCIRYTCMTNPRYYGSYERDYELAESPY